MADPLSSLGRAYDPINTRQDASTIPASSAAGLTRVLTLVAKRGKPATIVLTRRIVVSAGFTIPAACEGLTITQSGGATIAASGQVSTLFTVLARGVTFDGLSVERTSAAKRVLTFCAIADSAAGAHGLVIQRCRLEVSSVFVDDYSDCDSALIANNFVARLDVTSLSIIKSSGLYGAVVGNSFQPSFSTGLSIEFGANLAGTRKAANWTVAGNALGGPSAAYGGITSTSSNGGHYFAANTLVGTKTLHANDIDLDARIALALKSATTTVNVSAAAAPTAGQVLTATSDSAATWQTPSGGWTTVTKTATETRTSTTTFADDAALLVPMAANTTYRFRMAVHLTTTTAADFKFQLSGPASPTTVRWSAAFPSSIDGSTHTQRFSSAYTMSFGVVDEATGTVIIEGLLINGANAGTLALQWAQNSSQAVNTSVLKGSYLEYAVVA